MCQLEPTEGFLCKDLKDGRTIPLEIKVHAALNDKTSRGG